MNYNFGNYERDAKEMGMVLNPDKNIVNLILSGLEKNGEKYGYQYCPCKVQKIDDNVCICKDMREYRECCCKLFIKGDN
jgi:ferredoxin-thioredoxin reductase catalytic subunit